MSYVEREIVLPNIIFSDLGRKIILSDDGKHYITSILVDEKWSIIRKSTSYNQCYLALFPKQKKWK